MLWCISVLNYICRTCEELSAVLFVHPWDRQMGDRWVVATSNRGREGANIDSAKKNYKLQVCD